MPKIDEKKRCIAHPSFMYTTMCGKPWKAGDGVVAASAARHFDVCVSCEISMERRMEDEPMEGEDHEE